MNKAELVAAMAEKAELSKKDAEAALKAFTDVVAEELKKGEKIKLTVFSSKEIQRDDKDFVAGIIDETGKERYVMHAVDIIHDFYVKKDGKYKVFVENRYKKKIKIGIAICVEK